MTQHQAQAQQSVGTIYHTAFQRVPNVDKPLQWHQAAFARVERVVMFLESLEFCKDPAGCLVLLVLLMHQALYSGLLSQEEARLRGA